jgi:DNA-binding transcriptional regulator/RsmH inhibitor MraZ
MLRLVGNRRIKLDAKGRLVLPADFKKAILAALQEEGAGDSEASNLLYLYPSSEALLGFTPAGHDAWVGRRLAEREKKRASLGIAEDDLDDFDDDESLDYYSMTTSIEMDAAGRISLSKLDKDDPDVRRDLGISGEIFLVGHKDHFEIWNADRWMEKRKKMRAHRGTPAARG